MIRRGAAAVALAAAALVRAPGTPAASIDLEPGQWLVGVVIEIPGGRGPNPGNLEHEMCLTPADAQQLIVPPGSPCRISNLHESASEISWSIECTQGSMRTRGGGRLEFLGNRFKGSVETRADPPYDVHVIQHLAGKRLGPCKFPPKPAQPLRPYPGG